uniref:Methyltransferase domain-containing protein n=1 Tax=Ditylum brightwellii TaxID=49249 RepID=A0A7S2EUL7_9STRA
MVALVVTVCHFNVVMAQRQSKSVSAFSSVAPSSALSLLTTRTRMNSFRLPTKPTTQVHRCLLLQSSHMQDMEQNMNSALFEYDDTATTIPSSEMATIKPRRCFLSDLLLGSGATFLGSTLLSSQTAFAITPQEASKSYDTYATTYDDLDGGSVASALGIDDARSALLATASGNVLEIGVGTGLNVNKYIFAPTPDDDGSGGVTSLTLVDVSEGMLAQAKIKVESLDIPNHIKVEFIKADATSTELVDKFSVEKFDTVIDTFSLCVMGNKGAQDCLGQMSQLVKKKQDGGRILLIENTKSSNPLLGWYQDVTAEAAASTGGKGCLYNQDVTAMIKKTHGLNILKEDSFSGGLFRSFVCVKE